MRERNQIGQPSVPGNALAEHSVRMLSRRRFLYETTVLGIGGLATWVSLRGRYAGAQGPTATATAGCETPTGATDTAIPDLSTEVNNAERQKAVDYLTSKTPDTVIKTDGVNPPDAQHLGYWRVKNNQDETWYPGMVPVGSTDVESGWLATTDTVSFDSLGTTVTIELNPDAKRTSGPWYPKVTLTDAFKQKFASWAQTYYKGAFDGKTIHIQLVPNFTRSQDNADFVKLQNSAYVNGKLTSAFAEGMSRVGNDIFLRLYYVHIDKQGADQNNLSRTMIGGLMIVGTGQTIGTHLSPTEILQADPMFMDAGRAFTYDSSGNFNNLVDFPTN